MSSTASHRSRATLGSSNDPGPPLVLSGDTRLTGVIGDPIRHSLTPVVFNAAFAELEIDWVSLAFEVRAREIEAALRGAAALGVEGFSVTMPHKESAAEVVDECSEDARALGAVNSIRFDDGRLVGHNTDGQGCMDTLRLDLGCDPRGATCAVLGAGGSARAVVLALARAGAERVLVVNRSRDRAEAAASLAPGTAEVAAAETVGGVDVLINATPVGMSGGVAGVPLDVGLLTDGQVLLDLVYDPLETELMATARARGLAVANGVPMLVRQAARQLELWTGREPPVATMMRAAEGELRSRQR